MAGDRRPHVLQVRDFPPDLHRQVKALAALKGVTIREAMVSAATAWCDSQEDGPARLPPRRPLH